MSNSVYMKNFYPRSGHLRQRLYIVSAGEYFKVGISCNINRRIKEMQTGCPLEIDIVQDFDFDYNSVESIEHVAHMILAEYNVTGEWFKCEIRVIRDAIDMAYVEVMEIAA